MVRFIKARALKGAIIYSCCITSAGAFARPHSAYSMRTTVHISTTGRQLAVIGTLPWLSWERSEGAFGHGQAALSTN